MSGIGRSVALGHRPYGPAENGDAPLCDALVQVWSVYTPLAAQKRGYALARFITDGFINFPYTRVNQACRARSWRLPERIGSKEL